MYRSSGSFDSGTGYRRSAAGCNEYAEYAKYAVECNRRPRIGENFQYRRVV